MKTALPVGARRRVLTALRRLRSQHLQQQTTWQPLCDATPRCDEQTHPHVTGAVTRWMRGPLLQQHETAWRRLCCQHHPRLLACGSEASGDTTADAPSNLFPLTGMAAVLLLLSWLSPSQRPSACRCEEPSGGSPPSSPPSASVGMLDFQSGFAHLFDQLRPAMVRIYASAERHQPLKDAIYLGSGFIYKPEGAVREPGRGGRE